MPRAVLAHHVHSWSVGSTHGCSYPSTLLSSITRVSLAPNAFIWPPAMGTEASLALLFLPMLKVTYLRF